MPRWWLALPAALGLASSLAGCATRQFVRAEITRSEAALAPDVDRVARDVHEHRAGVRWLAIQVAAVGRESEAASRAAIEALGIADMAAGKAADAVDRATLALARADAATGVAAVALAGAEGTAQRLARQWSGRARSSIVEAVVLRFDMNDSGLDHRVRAALLGVVRRLHENPALVVVLEGYTDSAGPSPYNVRLSQLRADAVGRFLAEQGVELHRLQAIGLGTANPVADNATSDGRRQNRRVVLKLLDPS